MKNIAIALNAGSPPQRNAITNYAVRKGWAYWHWINDFWIVQVPDSWTPRTLHDALESLPEVGSTTILLFEFEGTVEFWGRAPEDAWKWLEVIGKPSNAPK